MRYRDGFVSNSSSSSFLIVGTYNREIIKKVAEKMGKYNPVQDEYSVECSYGYEVNDHFNFYGSYDPEYMGIDVSKKIKSQTFQELQKEFQQIIQDKYGVEIHQGDIDLYFGEVGEG